MYLNKRGQGVAVPRHKELNKWTAKAILKRAAEIGILVGAFYGFVLWLA
jgi:hypothetical protein